ncbi:MAG: FAD-dependent oxidoreductase [Chloroflexota bacterium]
MVDIIQGIKKRAGQDFAIIALFNSAEIRLKNGITPEEGQSIARIMEKAGADAIHTRAEYYLRPGVIQCESTHFPDIAFYPEPLSHPGEKIDSSQHGKGAWIPLAAGIKQAVSIPVIGIGRLDPLLGEEQLRRGMVDYIAMNRRLFADPELPNKVASGRLDDIVPCTGCMTCWEAGMTYKAATCQVNTAFGIEKEYEIKPAARKRRVMVVGGGPAGLEAARVAALRGHSVTLYEKEPKLGGSMNVATVVKGVGKEDLPSLVRYFETQLTKLGVDVRLGKEVNLSLIEEIKPDVLVISVGGIHNVPNIPGINQRNVVTGKDLHLRLKKYLKFLGPTVIRRLTNVWMPIGKKVVVMGGNIQGCQVAEFLVKRGRQVTIVETNAEVGEGLLTAYMKPLLLNWLIEKGVNMIAGAKFEEVTGRGLTITTKEGNSQTIEADTIVTALPLLPNSELTKSLDGKVKEIYSIGDCQEPGLIVNAIATGSRIARAI